MFRLFETISKQQLSNILYTLLFKFSLDVIYLFYINPTFEYNGFILEYSHLKNILSLLVLILFAYLLPQKVEKVSEITIQTLFILLFIPINTFWVMTNESSEWYFIVCLFWFIFIFIAKSKYEFKELPQVHQLTEKSFFILICIICTIGLLIIGFNAKWSFNLDLFAVYEIRSQEPLKHVPFSGYLVSWINLFLRFILVFAIVKYIPRLNALVMLALIVFVVLFSISGHKSIFFTPILLLGSYFLLKLNPKHFYKNLILILLFVFFTGSCTYFILDDAKILTLAARRVFLVPAQLSFYYFDFFQENHVYLSNSIFSGIMEYPFEVPTSNLIGREFFAREDMNANNGVVADGYMHFGVLGVVLWSIILGLIIKFCDMLTINKPLLIFLPLFLIGTRILVNGALLTTLFTHGLLMLMLIAYLYPKKKTI